MGKGTDWFVVQAFSGMTLVALELQNTSVRFGGLPLLCLSAPWSARGGRGPWGGEGLINLATTLCVCCQLEIWVG